MEDDRGMSRRGFVRAAAGGTAVAAATGTTSAQEASPDYGGWLSDVGNHDGSTADARGQEEVTITVGAQGNGGAFAFDPPAVWVDTGTTVVWEWTGEGSPHNVHAQEGADFVSETVAEEGFTFEQTIEESTIAKYQCDPHAGVGMKGAVAVGDDIATQTVSEGGGGCTEDDLHSCGVPIQAHFVGLATILMIVVSSIFTFFLLKYGESPHTSGGN